MSGRSSGNMRRWPNLRNFSVPILSGKSLPNTPPTTHGGRRATCAGPATTYSRPCWSSEGRSTPRIVSGRGTSTGPWSGKVPQRRAIWSWDLGRTEHGATAAENSERSISGAKRRGNTIWSISNSLSSTITSRARAPRTRFPPPRFSRRATTAGMLSTAGRRAKRVSSPSTSPTADVSKPAARRPKAPPPPIRPIRPTPCPISNPSANAAPKSICSPTSASCRTVPTC